MIKNTNDGSKKRPYLRTDFNYAIFRDLPNYSSGPNGDESVRHQAIKENGYMGIQNGIPEICREIGLGVNCSGRINKPGDLQPLMDSIMGKGFECCTLHVGWGMESDREVAELVEAVLYASENNNFPLYIETHRATITQDLWRCVELTKRWPEIRFNADFSHYYTGLEMPYGEMNEKLEFLQPVFDRVRYVQGRIGNSGSLQVDIGDGTGRQYVDHHTDMWRRSFEGFLNTATAGDFICFNAELLGPENFYARLIKDKNGNEVEECDRWEQSLLYKDLANTAFALAEKSSG